MERVLKIYDSGAPLDFDTNGLKLIAKYPAFTVVEAPDDAAERLSRTYLLEDITSQYAIDARKNEIPTSIAQVDAKTKRKSAEAARKRAKRLPPGPHHYVVQFVGPIKSAWLNQARKAGAQLVQPYEGFSYIANMAEGAVEKVAELPCVLWVGHLPYELRIASHALAGAGRDAGEPLPNVPRTRIRPGVYTVQFFLPEQAAKAAGKIKRLGFRVLSDQAKSGLIIVQTDKTARRSLLKQLDALSRVHGVSRISERPIKRSSNNQAAVIMETAAALGPAHGGLQLSGAGEVIAVADTGLDSGDKNNLHPDFAGRVLSIKSYPITPDFDGDVYNPGADDGAADIDSGHGTHTSGSVLGAGVGASNLPNLNGPIRGLSYRSQLVFQAIEQEMHWRNPRGQPRFVLSGIPSDLKTLFADAYAKGARIHSNSWGGSHPGEYDEQCRQVDAFVWSKPDFCVLFAAGNDGTDQDRDGIVDLGSVTAPGTAKNCITVGACESRRPEFTQRYGSTWPNDYPAEPIRSNRLADNPDEIAAFSSRGPTRDGRIKPDVVAPGTFILSTRSRMIAPNNFGWARFQASDLYMYDCGTSMATPLTAGAVGIIREFLRKKCRIASPSAALLKAALIAGAQYLKGVSTDNNAQPFDYHQGFGRVNVDAVVSAKPPIKLLFIEGAGLSTGDMTERVIRLGSSSHPLRIVLAYSDYPGPRLVNNLNLIVKTPDGRVLAGNGSSPSGESLDAANNVEIVQLERAPKGEYRVQIVGSNVPRAPQPFALVVRGAVAD